MAAQRAKGDIEDEEEEVDEDFKEEGDDDEGDEEVEEQEEEEEEARLPFFAQMSFKFEFSATHRLYYPEIFRSMKIYNFQTSLAI